MKLYRYILPAFLAMALFSSCSDDAVAVRQQGVDTDPLTIKAEFGKNLVGRVTVDGRARQGVVVSDGVSRSPCTSSSPYSLLLTWTSLFLLFPQHWYLLVQHRIISLDECIIQMFFLHGFTL